MSVTDRAEAREASLRRLHGLVRSINADLDLPRTLEAVCRGVVDGLGFGVAVVNLVMPDGALEVVACAGDDAARDALVGQRASREVWDTWLAACVPVGELLVDYRHDRLEGDVPVWVPELPAAGVEGGWDPEDALLAPLRTAGSGLLGVVSVDLPEDGLRPGPEQLELLEMYAAQASVAVENATLHSALLARETLRSRALGRLSAVVGSAPVAIVELDLEGRVQLWNAAAERIFGWSADEVLDSRNPVAPQDGQYEAILQGLRDDGVLHRVTTTRPRRDGSQVDVEMTTTVLTDERGRTYGYLGVYVDVTQRVQLEQELREAAFTDALTGLANRAQVTARLATSGPDTHVVLLDLDGFKAVNDALGHEAGDQVLVEVAARLRAACRDEDLVGRLGGDEFVVLLPGVPGAAGSGAPGAAGSGAAQRLSRRLVEVLAQPFVLGDRLVTLGASVGLATASPLGAAAVDTAPGGGAGQALLRDADVAMYAAKASGKGRVQVFEPALREAVVRRDDLVQDLRTALAQDQLFLRWHPVAAVPSGRVVGLEALVRWQHPVRGELLPADFLGLAEETGLVVPLGEQVLQQACAALRAWQDLPGQRGRPPGRRLTASVNLSPVQVRADGLVDAVRRALQDSGLEPGDLALELTEDVPLVDVDQAVEVLQALRDLGVRLAVDDFGTGCSSLAHLTRLPIDVVKLDRSLLYQAQHDPASLALLDAVAGLARRLGLLAVAEGVETGEQWSLLERLGIPMAQGFLLARPLLAADVPPLLLDRRARRAG